MTDKLKHDFEKINRDSNWQLPDWGSLMNFIGIIEKELKHYCIIEFIPQIQEYRCYYINNDYEEISSGYRHEDKLECVRQVTFSFIESYLILKNKS